MHLIHPRAHTPWSSGHTHTHVEQWTHKPHTPGAVDTYNNLEQVTHTHTWSSGHTHTQHTHTHHKHTHRTHTPASQCETHTHTPHNHTHMQSKWDTHTHTQHTHTQHTHFTYLTSSHAASARESKLAVRCLAYKGIHPQSWKIPAEPRTHNLRLHSPRLLPLRHDRPSIITYSYTGYFTTCA